MPPNFCTSSVFSSMIASMMSSTVTMPSTRPALSMTGTASRSYFVISRATSSRSISGGRRDRRDVHGDRRDVGVGVGEDQPPQRHRAGQPPRQRVEHVDRVDGFAGALDLADVLQRLGDASSSPAR